MADPQPAADQGFLPGLLGKVRDFFPDPAAAYSGLLSDEATRRAFAWRELGAAAGAFSQGAMPVPYKGGIPFGATLGAAGAAASTAGDALMHARLEAAQTDLAQQQGLLAHGQTGLIQALPHMLDNYYGPDKGGGAATGTGGKGQPAPGSPQDIIRQQGGGGGDGGIGGNQLYGFLRSFDYPGVAPATPQEASFLTGNAKIESNFNPDAEHDGAFLAKKGLPPGYGLWGDNADRLAAMRKDSWVGPTDNVPWQQQAIWQLQELRKSDQGAAVNAAKTPGDLANLSIDYLRPDTKQNDGYRAERGNAINTYLTNPPGTQTAEAPAPAGPVGGYGPDASGVYIPPGGTVPLDIQTGQPIGGAAPAPAGAPPMALPAAARGLLDTSQGPLGSSAAPPNLAIPPAAGAPGKVTGLLGQQPAQQVAAADAPPLTPAAEAVLQGINRQQGGGGLPASGAVAGDNAVPTGGPSPTAVTQQAIPHTGAAGAAELAGLLAQPPAGAAPPTATPYTNAPPVTGQGAPAPGPAAPVQTSQAPVAAPAPPQAAPMPGVPSPEKIAQARQIEATFNALHMTPPADIVKTATFPLDVALEAEKKRAGLPYTPFRPNTSLPIMGPDGRTIIGWQTSPADPTIQPGPPDANGRPTQRIIYPSTIPGEPARVVTIPGPSGPSPQQTAAGTAAGTEAGRHAPTGVPGSSLIGTPNFAPLPNAPDPTKPIQTARGTFMPGTDKQTLPSNYVDYDKVQDHWNEWNHDLVTAQTLAGAAEAQINMIINAAKQNEMGGGTEGRAALGNFLIGNHIVDEDWVKQHITDVGAVQTMLYAQARDTLTTLAAVNKRFTGGEFKITSQSGASPNQLNSANLPILAQDLAKVRQIQGVAENWAQAQRTQYADGSTWRNPLSFVSNWYTMNPLGKLQEQTMQQIGPLAGQTTVPGVPQGATPTGKTIAGWPEYNLPGRTGTYTFPGQWKDR